MKSRGLESMDTGQLRVLREKGLAEKLGVSRDTARKIRHGDPTFPRRRVIWGDVEGDGYRARLTPGWNRGRYQNENSP